MGKATQASLGLILRAAIGSLGPRPFPVLLKRRKSAGAYWSVDSENLNYLVVKTSRKTESLLFSYLVDDRSGRRSTGKPGSVTESSCGHRCNRDHMDTRWSALHREGSQNHPNSRAGRTCRGNGCNCTSAPHRASRKHGAWASAALGGRRGKLGASRRNGNTSGRRTGGRGARRGIYRGRSNFA